MATAHVKNDAAIDGRTLDGHEPKRTQCHTRTRRRLALFVVAAVIGCQGPDTDTTNQQAGAGTPPWSIAARDAAMQRLEAATGNAAIFGLHKATSAARFLRLSPGASARLSPIARTAAEKTAAS